MYLKNFILFFYFFRLIKIFMYLEKILFIICIFFNFEFLFRITQLQY